VGSLDETTLNLHGFIAYVLNAFFLSCHVTIYVVYVENILILYFHVVYVFFTNKLIYVT